MFKLIISLLWNRAKKAEWQLQIGAFLLRRGSGFELGKVTKEQKVSLKRFKVKRVIGLTYHFGTKKIRPLYETANVRLK
jgi:hypothetical protein